MIVDSKLGGVWVGLWGDEDSPEFITAGRMRIFDPPKRILFSDFEYFARRGPLPFAANLTSEFTVNPIEPEKHRSELCRTDFRPTMRRMSFMQAVRLAGAKGLRAFGATWRASISSSGSTFHFNALSDLRTPQPSR